jgi:hypothetical protein
MPDFILYFPFELESGRVIAIAGLPRTHVYENIHLELNIIGEPYYYIKISGLQSEEEAKAYVNKVRLGLAFIEFRNHYGVDFNSYIQCPVIIEKENKAPMYFLGAEIPVEGTKIGMIEEKLPAVYSSDVKILKMHMGDVGIRAETDSESIFMSFLEGTQISNNLVLTNKRLEAALDIYKSHFFVNSVTAKFLFLVMVLETLTSSRLKNKLVLKIMEEWKKQISLIITKYRKKDRYYKTLVDLESLKRELFYRRENSLRSQIRELVYTALASMNDSEVDTKAKKALKLYDKRSFIVHGNLISEQEINRSFEELRPIVEDVLISIIKTGTCLEQPSYLGAL